MVQYKGASRQHEIRSTRRRKDTRLLGQKFTDFYSSPDGAVLGLMLLPLIALFTIKLPFSGELILLIAWLYKRTFVSVEKRVFDFPFRAPIQSNLFDGSTPGGKGKGKGITLLGNESGTKDPIFAHDSDLRTHMLVLGTTGSGKTEFLLGLVFNALVQNTGFIYVDGKGDPKLQKDVFRLARYLGREDDLLIINFITSGRDFVDKQADQVTNNMNIMGNTSSGMLIELIVSLMDDSGGGGDMWKGRAISFVAALSRPLIYLRDKGHLNLSPEKYLEYFELNIIEELVWEHNGKYGDLFDVIVAPLRSYLITLPGYQKSKKKAQEQKTLEQHGFIVMQLTRIFNDLTFNYAHIFRTKVGDVDFFDVVINRRLLVVLLPALERAPDSLRMLGKMIVGSIKQMMAGALGNRVEGIVREIIDSRPTNAEFPFYVILDEYGYYAVVGFAVAPAQARSLGFSVTFAAQDFSSLKKSSAEEADATWENTNVRAVGRITSGQKSETWERLQGASGESEEARMGGFDRKVGMIGDAFQQQNNISIERRARLDYDDLAMQENGEFTFLIGKKDGGGRTGGVRVIRGMGFYTGSKEEQKEMRTNQLVPVEAPEPADLPQNRKSAETLMLALIDGSFPKSVYAAIKGQMILSSMHQAFDANHTDPKRAVLTRRDASRAVMGWFLSGAEEIKADRAQTATDAASGASQPPASIASTGSIEGATPPPSIPNPPERTAPVIDVSDPTDQLGLQRAGAEKALLNAANFVNKNPRKESAYPTATPYKMADDDDEIVISANVVTTNILMTKEDSGAFRDKALPILRQHLFLLEPESVTETDWEDDLDVADSKQLLELEVVANGRAFSSLDDKWATQERINEVRDRISDATHYIHPPEPEKIDLPKAKSILTDLTEQCHKLMKSPLQDK